MLNVKSAYETVRNADMGIIPIEPTSELPKGTSVPLWQAKSENRLKLKMFIGFPVVATPIPTYESTIESGRNGFFANSRADWLRDLEILRDLAARSEIGHLARVSLISRYSMKGQARLLIEALRLVSRR